MIRVHGEGSRCGLARSGVLLLLAAVLAGSLIVLFLVGRDTADHVDVQRAAGAHAAVDESTAPPESSASSRRPAETHPESAKPSAAPAIENAGADDTQGPGVIRGRITALPGTELPKSWTLVIEPHPYLQGRERAVTRRLEFSNGEQEFKVEGLPLAGYNVRAQAPGLNDVSCSALLVQGSSNVFVNPQFRPAGFIDGNVIDATGAPAEGVLVTITSQPAHVRLSARTDARGNYVIPNVTDGDYSLSIGTPEAPLLKPDRLAFKAPSMRFPTRQLPETGSLRLTTLDETGRALSSTEVSGFSTSGGAFRVTTDSRGKAEVRYLLPGKYRLEAKIEDGRKAGQWVDVSAKPETNVELRLKP